MKTNRREFIGGILAAGAAPMLFNGCASAFRANGRVNVGVVGFGRIAHSMDVPNTIRYIDLCRFTAVCDIDAKRREYGAKFIREKYAKMGETGAQVKTYADYHEMFADPSIDAVMLCVPDHWHAILATDAILAGKHIWLQKPFTQTIEEGRILRELAIRCNRVVQVGSWQRSVSQFAKVCELVRNGRIGNVVRVEVGCGCDKEGGSSTVQLPPATFDYDTWLGPTDGTAPYNETRCHSQDLKKIDSRPGWIQLEPYGWGMITNWGAHQIDIAQWGLGMDDSGPESVRGTCGWMKTDGGKLWNVHTTYDLHYSYNGGKTDVHVCNKYPQGIKFVGEKGDWLYCMRGKAVTASDPKTSVGGKMQPLMASDRKLLEPMTDCKNPVHTSDDHFRNWLEGVLAEDPKYTVTNAWEAQRSATACTLGYMCMKLGREIKWDAKSETTTTPGAAELMKPFERGRFNLEKAKRKAILASMMLGLLAMMPAGAAEYVTTAWEKKFVDAIPSAEMSKGLVVVGTPDKDHGIFGGELVLRGTNNVAPPFVRVGKNARLTIRQRLQGEPLEVDVTYGGVLDCSAVRGGQAVRRIKVDCKEGAGSLSNVRLVGTGTLELLNVDSARATGQVPLDLSAAVDGKNIEKWNLLIDGKSEPANGRLVYDRGAIEWREGGCGEGGWSCLPMWGGGYMQNVVFTSDPNVLYAYADVCGPFRSSDAGKTWQLLGANFSLGARAQMMGICRTLSVDPRDPDSVVIMAGGEGRHNAGGFMVSRNGGKSWRKTGWHPVYCGSYHPTGLILARNPNNPDVLVGGCDWQGICLSLNNGDTWTRTGPTQQWYTCIHWDKVQRDRIYACGVKIASTPYFTPSNGKPREGGLFVSEDAGRHWHKLAKEAPLEIVQMDGSEELVGIFGEGSFRRSCDGGKNWKDFSKGIPDTNCQYRALACVGEAYVTANFKGEYYRRAKQDGEWKPMPKPKLVCSDPPHEPYASAHVTQKQDKDKVMWAACSIVVDPRDERHWFVTDWFEIWETHDAGATFATSQSGISQLCSMTFECDPLSPDHMAYGVHDMAFIMSHDGGKSFIKTPTFWLDIYGGGGHVVVNSVAFSPHEAGVVFAASYCAYGGFGIERSLDHGVTWDFPKCAGLPRRVLNTNAVNTVVFRPDRNELWACVGGVIGEGKGGPYYSTDKGESWTWAGQGMNQGAPFYRLELESGGPVQQIAFSSDGSGVTLARGGPGVYAWDDGTRKWSEVKLPPGARTWKCYSLVADPFVGGRFLIGGESQIAESLDGGKTWHAFAGYKGECTHLAFDRNTKGLLVLACADAMRVSWDGGKTFEVLPDGYKFDSLGITSLASNYSFCVPQQLTVDRKRIYFATSAAGVYCRELKSEK